MIENILVSKPKATIIIPDSTDRVGGLIPMMTSNTQPSGIVDASSFHPGDGSPYYAFAKEESLRWTNYRIGSQTEWLSYKFPVPVQASRLILAFRAYPDQFAGIWVLEGSNNGNNWTIVLSVDESKLTDNKIKDDQYRSFRFSPSVFQWWRFRMIAKGTTYAYSPYVKFQLFND